MLGPSGFRDFDPEGRGLKWEVLRVEAVEMSLVIRVL